MTALGLAEDLKKGLIDRFRSLPMARSAVLDGRTLADVGTNVVQLVVMLARRLLGRLPLHDGASATCRRRSCCCSRSATRSRGCSPSSGCVASSPEAANAYGFTVLFPVTFVSSAFVPVGSMPCWLQPVAEHNPFTIMVNAARALFLGTPAGNDVWLRRALVGRDHRRVRRARRLALPPGRREVATS